MKQVLCFGDSNTWGLIPGTTERYPWGVRWTSILQDKLEQQDMHIIENGLCGRTTVFDDAFRPYRNASKGLPLELEVHSDLDTIILMLGTNDCKSYNKASAAVIGHGVEKLLEQIRGTHPQARVLLVSPILLGEKIGLEEFDPEFDDTSYETAKGLKEVYAGIAKKWNVDFLAASDFARPSNVDQEHMDETGHAALAEALYKRLAA